MEGLHQNNVCFQFLPSLWILSYGSFCFLVENLAGLHQNSVCLIPCFSRWIRAWFSAQVMTSEHVMKWIWTVVHEFQASWLYSCCYWAPQLSTSRSLHNGYALYALIWHFWTKSWLMMEACLHGSDKFWNINLKHWIWGKS